MQGLSAWAIHVHRDNDSYVEVAALKGSSGDAQHFADRIIAQRGIRYGGVALIPASAKTKSAASPSVRSVAQFENMPAGVLFRLCEGPGRGRTPPMFCCAELTSFTRAEGRMVNHHRPTQGSTGG
jgi:NikR C terminal nickel binding domain